MKRRTDIGETIFGLYRGVVTGFFAVILAFLLFFASFSTCYMVTDWTERTFFVRDSVLLNLGAFLAAVLAMTSLKRIQAVSKYLARVEAEEALFRKWKRILLGIIMGMALVWVLASRGGVQGDQEYLQNAVYDLNTQNYLMFSEGGYLYRFAQQRGLTAVLYLFSLIFGSYNSIAFQVFNGIGIGLFYDRMCAVCGEFGMGRVVRLKVLLYGILFFPLIMYCSFVYGNIWGMALALSALGFELRFLSCLKIRHGVAAALLIGLTLLVKSNYIVFLIGMLLLAGLELIRKKKVKILLFPVLAVALWAGQGRVVNLAFEQASGASFGQEASKWSWIAMGLQEGGRAPGWYNDFVWYTYDESGCNTEAHDMVVKGAIRDSLAYFAANRWEAAEFFTKKMVSQWNNPTFQSFWMVQVQPAESVRSNWVWHFISAAGAHKSTVFLNLFQFFILAGALIYCMTCRKLSNYGKSLALPMIFIGGTLCHLVWEAKGQYVLTYFVLLFPYAAEGYHWVTDCLAAWGGGEAPWKDAAETFHGKAAGVTSVLVAAAVLAGMGLLCAGGCLSYLTEDTREYYQYLQEMDVTPKLPDGVYRLGTEGGFVLDLPEDGGQTPALCASEEAGLGSLLQVVNYQDTAWLHFVENGFYLLGSDTAAAEGWAVTAQPSQRKEEERWSIKAAGDGGIYIMYDTYFALAYNEETGSVHLELFAEENANQVWYAEAVDPG